MMTLNEKNRNGWGKLEVDKISRRTGSDKFLIKVEVDLIDREKNKLQR